MHCATREYSEQVPSIVEETMPYWVHIATWSVELQVAAQPG
jgi:hypothetical protein